MSTLTFFILATEKFHLAYNQFQKHLHLKGLEKSLRLFSPFLFQPFFKGKLILHDGNGGNGVGATAATKAVGMNSMTSTLNAAQAAAIMPSPAEQVTDLLISPKYDTEDDEGASDDDEEDSDDTVYECPGLAATSGEALMVSNPFYLQGEELAHLRRASEDRQPQPINQSSIFHHGIKGFN